MYGCIGSYVVRCVYRKPVDVLYYTLYVVCTVRGMMHCTMPILRVLQRLIHHPHADGTVRSWSIVLYRCRILRIHIQYTRAGIPYSFNRTISGWSTRYHCHVLFWNALGTMAIVEASWLGIKRGLDGLQCSASTLLNLYYFRLCALLSSRHQRGLNFRN